MPWKLQTIVLHVLLNVHVISSLSHSCWVSASLLLAYCEVGIFGKESATLNMCWSMLADNKSSGTLTSLGKWCGLNGITVGFAIPLKTADGAVISYKP